MEKRIVDGQLSVWKLIRKKKLISIRQERNLLAGLIIISKARNLDLKELIGNNEYNIVRLQTEQGYYKQIIQLEKNSSEESGF